MDPFGRPDPHTCCRGNLYAVQGSGPTKSSVAENAAAMGIDPAHMGWNTLAQSTPPVMAQLVASQLAMRVAHERFGVPMFTFDEMLRRPGFCRRTLARWMRGVGEERGEAALELMPVEARMAKRLPRRRFGLLLFS